MNPIAQLFLRLEHRSEQLLSVRRFILRVGQFGFFAFLIMLLSLFGGTLGYRYFAEVSWVDGFYQTCMVLTGMGPVVDMPSTSAKLFSSFFALYSSFAFLSITAVIFAPIVHRILHILHLERPDSNGK